MSVDTNLRLLTERAALGQTSLTTGRLGKDLSARAANDNSLGVGEDGGDGEAARALDVHEERVGVLHKSLEFVAASLLLGGGVKKVDGESLREGKGKHERESMVSRLSEHDQCGNNTSRSAAKQQQVVGGLSVWD